MFRRLEGIGDPVRFSFDGVELVANRGENLALALLASGVSRFRHAAPLGDPRGPLCLMGVCFDCLVTIADQPDCQACMVEVTEGMAVFSRDRGPQ